MVSFGIFSVVYLSGSRTWVCWDRIPEFRIDPSDFLLRFIFIETRVHIVMVYLNFQKDDVVIHRMTGKMDAILFLEPATETNPN